MTEKELNEWWFSTCFEEMGRITKLRYWDFDPEDGYQDYVDVCDNWWKSLSIEEKQDIYDERH